MMKNNLLALLSLLIIFLSCSKKKDPKPEPFTIDKTELSTNFDKEHQFIINQGPNKIEPGKIKFSSSNVLTGTITASGLFDAKRIGKTTIKAEIEGAILVSEVTVTPYSTMVKEPFLEYSSTKSKIKTQETRVIQEETENALLYKGENSKVRIVFYSFENGLMQGAIIAFDDANAVIQESQKFFSERYNYVGEDDDKFFFRDQSSIVVISYSDTIGFNAVYIKNTTGTSTSNDLKTLKRIYSESKESAKLKQLLK